MRLTQRLVDRVLAPQGEWEPRALLRVECCPGRTPSVELSFERRGDELVRWAHVRKVLQEQRWG